MFPFASQLYWDADFIFQHDLVPIHTAKSIIIHFNNQDITVFDWPVNSPDFSDGW